MPRTSTNQYSISESEFRRKCHHQEANKVGQASKVSGDSTPYSSTARRLLISSLQPVIRQLSRRRGVSLRMRAPRVTGRQRSVTVQTAVSIVKSVIVLRVCEVFITGVPEKSYVKMKSSPRAAPYHVPSNNLSSYYNGGYNNWLDTTYSLPSAYSLGIPATTVSTPDPPGQGRTRATVAAILSYFCASALPMIDAGRTMSECVCFSDEARRLSVKY
ncbi:hypothetical protein J6590_017627 [Homalodisca vitripennis]|nr:hypothetical protein J6590_017627 [Homalodisca vitripennis]